MTATFNLHHKRLTLSGLLVFGFMLGVVPAKAQIATGWSPPQLLFAGDGWTQFSALAATPDGKVHVFWHRNRNQRWEREVFESADRIVAVTDSMTKQFQSQYDDSIARRISTVTNGYDTDDFVEDQSCNATHQRLRVVYTGSLNGIRRADAFLMTVVGA